MLELIPLRYHALRQEEREEEERREAAAIWRRRLVRLHSLV